IFWWRDQVVEEYDDSSHERFLVERRIELVRGEGRVAEPGRLEVGGQEREYADLVIATGSVPSIPPIQGLDGFEYWTSREATSARAVPRSLLVIGGGVVGCEIAQFYRRVGSHVTIVEVVPRLLRRDDSGAAALLQEGLVE